MMTTDTTGGWVDVHQIGDAAVLSPHLPGSRWWTGRSGWGQNARLPCELKINLQERARQPTMTVIYSQLDLSPQVTDDTSAQGAGRLPADQDHAARHGQGAGRGRDSGSDGDFRFRPEQTPVTIEEPPMANHAGRIVRGSCTLPAARRRSSAPCSCSRPWRCRPNGAAAVAGAAAAARSASPAAAVQTAARAGATTTTVAPTRTVTPTRTATPTSTTT